MTSRSGDNVSMIPIWMDQILGRKELLTDRNILIIGGRQVDDLCSRHFDSGWSDRFRCLKLESLLIGGLLRNGLQVGRRVEIGKRYLSPSAEVS